MAEYLHGGHTVSMLHCHIVWVTKYRKKILTSGIKEALRDLIRQICEKESVKILSGHISADHIHLFLSYPPKVALSKLPRRLKGSTSHKLMMTFPTLQKQYWGRHMWARGYFCCSSGNVTDDVIENYVQNQEHDIEDDDTFSI
jgi:putative transposase